jgi:hypothetical protein
MEGAKSKGCGQGIPHLEGTAGKKVGKEGLVSGKRLARYQGSLSLDTSRPELTVETTKRKKCRENSVFSSSGAVVGEGPR